MTTARHIIIALLLVLAQGAIDNYVNLSVYLDPSLCIYILLTLPPHWGAIPSMATGFILGLTVDVLGNGIPGMTAAAMTANGVFRRSIFNHKAPKENEKRQNFEAMGLRNFHLYSLPLIFIFLTLSMLL